MAIDPFFGSVASAGISSAGGLLGGFLSRPNHSQRDLMYIQNDIWREQMGARYPLEVRSLRRAGLNPILAVKNSPPPTSAGGAPHPYTDPVGAALGKAASSAGQAVRQGMELDRIKAETKNIKEQNRQIRATTENIAANTALTTAKTVTEGLQPSVIEINNTLNTAKSARERQLLQKDMFDTAIRKQELSIAEKDALVAQIDIDMYESSVGEVSRWLSNLGIQPKAAVGLAHMLWSYVRTQRRK